MKLKIMKISNEADANIKLPFYATSGSAAMDLHACIKEAVTIEPLCRAMIPTGIAIELPSNKYMACVFARSGLASKYGIALSNSVGVIDSDYRGEIKVSLINLSNEEYTVSPGDRIAQLAVMPVCQAEISIEEGLSATERGSGGFGSTGISS